MKKVIIFIALCMLLFIDESLARPKAVSDGLLDEGGLGDIVSGLGGGFSGVERLRDTVGGLTGGLSRGAGVGRLGDTVSGLSGRLTGISTGISDGLGIIVHLIAQLFGIDLINTRQGTSFLK